MKDIGRVPPGHIIGGFRVERLLGRGAMGEVYLAVQLAMDRKVALKVMASGLTVDKDAVERFLLEARTLARLEHPNIVTAFTSGEDGGVYYMAMAYVSDESLSAHLHRAGAMSEQEALRMALCVSRALAHAWNDHRIIHRDIKPANIMLDQRGEFRVMDLRLSKHLSGEAGLSLSGMMLGTPQYMSPEQVEGRHELDCRADIYALGATLYHVVTGTPPYSGSTPFEVLKSRAQEHVIPAREQNPGVSEACSRLIEKMMAHDVDDRPATWEEVVSLIEEAQRLLPKSGVQALSPTDQTIVSAQHLPMSAVRAPGTVKPASRRVQISRISRRTVLGAVLCVCVALLAFGGWRLLGPASVWAEAEVEVQRNGQAAGLWIPLREGGELSSRDRYRIRLRLDKDAWVYVVQLDNHGNLTWLAPHNPGSPFSSGVNPMAPGASAHLPAEHMAWQLDETPGLEAIYVYSARARWTELEALLNQPHLAHAIERSADGNRLVCRPLMDLPQSRRQSLILARTFRHVEHP